MSFPTVGVVDMIGSNPSHGRPALCYLVAYYKRTPQGKIASYLIAIEDTATGKKFVRDGSPRAEEAAAKWLSYSGMGVTVSACLQAAREAKRHYEKAVEKEGV